MGRLISNVVGPTLLVTKLDRLAPSIPYERNIVHELTWRSVKFRTGGDQIGSVVAASPRTVTRHLLTVSGDLAETSGRWNWESSFYSSLQPGSFIEHQLGKGARVLVSQYSFEK
ncbi:hypothetical protein [Rathayibacter tritici]|uniref:hypothetical protein n=1 Tax=Rathayibacter tritici TaxID=33888 RepID=UPI0011B0EBD4|nr:hypothetical protein [Rathayibacter tritici]